MEQTPATSQTAAPAPPQHQPDPGLDASVDSTSPPSPPGFGARGRVRRRARFLRKARELAYRDLGGLVFNLHRFGQRNDSLVLAKLATLSRIDAELRGLEAALAERQPVTVLREAGITACPRCAAIHSGEDRFCPNCGLPLSRRSDLPIAGMPAAAAPSPAAGVASAPTAGGQEATSAPSGGAGPTGAYSSPPPVAQPDPASVASAPPNPAAPPARAPTPPATKTYASVAPGDAGAGRSPAPPAAVPERPAPERDDDQPTEIIRPRPGGS